jgi:hypothetical protein
VYVGVGKLDVLVGGAKVIAEAVGVTVFSGNELQAANNVMNKIKLSNLNGIFIFSLRMLV